MFLSTSPVLCMIIPTIKNATGQLLNISGRRYVSVPFNATMTQKITKFEQHRKDTRGRFKSLYASKELMFVIDFIYQVTDLSFNPC